MTLPPPAPPALAYPRLVKRVRAVLIDTLLLPVAAIATAMLGSAAGVTHPYAKLMLLVGPVLLLEPCLVAYTGGTMGHHVMRLRVMRADGVRRLSLAAATLRFAVKLFLGWLSFVFVLATAKHQALHDLLARSIVIHRDPAGLPAYDVLAERSDDADYLYPPAWRRLLVIALYALLASAAYLGALVASAHGATLGACIMRGHCTILAQLLLAALRVLWFASLCWIAVEGWSGALLGARKRPRDAQDGGVLNVEAAAAPGAGTP